MGLVQHDILVAFQHFELVRGGEVINDHIHVIIERLKEYGGIKTDGILSLQNGLIYIHRLRVLY